MNMPRLPGRYSTRGRRPACLLSGGETTVTVRGSGLGGRNQEFVLAAILALNVERSDHHPQCRNRRHRRAHRAAGAIAVSGAGSSTLSRAAGLGMDAGQYLDNNDSYHFFEPLDALLKTGPTGTNVADVRILLIP